MGKHSAAEIMAAKRSAHAEARRRAVSVAKFGLVIALSVAVALVLFGGHKLPMS